MMNDSASPLQYASPSHRPPSLPWKLYLVEGLAAAGGNLLITAIFFYTTARYHWVLKQNFLLASGQGLFYIAGAMTAGAAARWFKRRGALAIVYFCMTGLALVAYFMRAQPIVVTVLLLLYSFFSTVAWPQIESLVSSDVDAHALSRRISVYNLCWGTISVVMLAVDGSLIVHWPAGIFLLPVAVHAAGCFLMLQSLSEEKRGAPSHADTAHAAVAPEPELLRVRTLAMWLSRVALPATYVVIFSLMALMPSLPVMQGLSPSTQTLLGSVWMASRLVAFFSLGLTTWWHTRPRLLLISAIVMLIAYFGVTVRPSHVLGHGTFAVDVATMIVAQIALGVTLGMIYSGSLYFGMVLSDGSTEHGGYHEALIGLGFVVGPGVGAIAQSLRPTNVYAGIYAVGAVVLLSVCAVVVTAILGGRKDRADN